MNVDKNQTTPAGAARSEQVTKFISESDRLIKEIKIKNLDIFGHVSKRHMPPW